MQVFLYEYFTGGGIGELPQGGEAASLLTEATAMAKAITTDFAALPSVRLITMRDSRLPAFQPAGCQVVEVGQDGRDLDILARLSSQSDWTLLIAPETDGSL